MAVDLDGRVPELEILLEEVDDGLRELPVSDRQAVNRSVQYLLAEDASEALLPYWFGDNGGINELERQVEGCRAAFGSFDARTVKAALAHLLALLKQGKFSAAMISYPLNIMFTAFANTNADAKDLQRENPLQYHYADAWRSLVMGYEGHARYSLESVLADETIKLTDRQRAKLLCDIAILATDEGNPEKAGKRFKEGLKLLASSVSQDDPLMTHYMNAAVDAQGHLGGLLGIDSLISRSSDTL